MQANTAMKATGGREASRERREQLVQGKRALPPAADRVRTGERGAERVNVGASAPAPAALPSAPAPAAAQSRSAPAAPSAAGAGMAGRAASMARRAGQVQGKAGLTKLKQELAPQNAPAQGSVEPSPVDTVIVRQDPSRGIAQAFRAARARNGRGDAPAARPSGRMRNPEPIRYAPKVAESKSYGGRKVTGVRIGRGPNVTGDEPGSALQVTGSQYVGTESGYNPREYGIKVGAARTTGGQIVTGTQVRSKVMITGDESNPALRITGEADQNVGDDLLNRREQGAYAQTQFQRQNNPHGHSVFGANLGRSIKSIGSRERDRARMAEVTEGGHAISGTAVGRSAGVTGDEPGACRNITGDQYLMPAAKQSLCTTPAMGAPKVGVSHTLHGARTTGTQVGQRLRARGAITGTADEGVCQAVSGDEYVGAEQYKGQCGVVPAPASGEKVVEASTWGGQRVTGVDVEHNPRVTGDEPGVCGSITGTPYAGPGQYQTYCEPEHAQTATKRVGPAAPGARFITGDTPLHVDGVTGTHRGAERAITGTPYYRAEREEEMKTSVLERVNQRFSVRSPQREAQLRADASLVEAPTAAGRITGSFAVGEGKITGSQEFLFVPRAKGERDPDKSRITGEGRAEGPAITGGAWDLKANVKGTEDYIAAERNPSQSAGKPHAFASAGKFKGKGTRREPTHHITGMVGWSPKTAAHVTVSGGAQG